MKVLFKNFALLLFAFCLLIANDVQSQASNGDNAAWEKFKKDFWKAFNGHWIEVHDSKDHSKLYWIYYKKGKVGNLEVDQIFMVEEDKQSDLINTDLTDFTNRIDIDIRKHKEQKSIYVYHIAEEDLEEKRRIENDIYINDRFGFNKNIKSFNGTSEYLELEDRYIKWENEKTVFQILIKGSPDVISIRLDRDKAPPAIKISDYPNYVVTYPVVSSETGKHITDSTKTSGFELHHDDLYGKWRDNAGKNIIFGPYGYCVNCPGDFWWAKKEDEKIQVEIYDLNKDKSNPVVHWDLNIEGTTLKDPEKNIVLNKVK